MASVGSCRRSRCAAVAGGALSKTTATAAKQRRREAGGASAGGQTRQLTAVQQMQLPAAGRCSNLLSMRQQKWQPCRFCMLAPLLCCMQSRRLCQLPLWWQLGCRMLVPHRTQLPATVLGARPQVQQRQRQLRHRAPRQRQRQQRRITRTTRTM